MNASDILNSPTYAYMLRLYDHIVERFEASHEFMQPSTLDDTICDFHFAPDSQDVTVVEFGNKVTLWLQLHAWRADTQPQLDNDCEHWRNEFLDWYVQQPS